MILAVPSPQFPYFERGIIIFTAMFQGKFANVCREFAGCIKNGTENNSINRIITGVPQPPAYGPDPLDWVHRVAQGPILAYRGPHRGSMGAQEPDPSWAEVT